MLSVPLRFSLGGGGHTRGAGVGGVCGLAPGLEISDIIQAVCPLLDTPGRFLTKPSRTMLPSAGASS